MNPAESNAVYRVLSKFYDMFDVLFILGGKGSPRLGLLDVTNNGSQRILEMCVGTATNTMLIARQSSRSQIIGIDISADMLAVARKKIDRAGLTNIELQVMPADTMQFAANSFDVVVVSFALHEFESDLRERIFREVARVLKPGGKFCVIDFARQANWSNRVFMKIWAAIEPPCFVNFLSLDWREHLRDYGLHFESEKEYSFSKMRVLRKAPSTSPTTNT